MATYCKILLPLLGSSDGLKIVTGHLQKLFGQLQVFSHAGTLEDESQNLDDRLWVWNRYGTAYRAMYTLYEITFVPGLFFRIYHMFIEALNMIFYMHVWELFDVPSLLHPFFPPGRQLANKCSASA